jgi:hypothetical protein
MLAGCALESDACTDIGCGAALTVDFIGDEWEAGSYAIVVTADGVTTTCAATLPFGSCETGWTCDRTESGFWLLTSGCALSAEQHALAGIEWTTAGPRSVTIELSRDGSSLGTVSGTLSYRSSQPNGADCEPTCETAQEQLSLSF